MTLLPDGNAPKMQNAFKKWLPHLTLTLATFGASIGSTDWTMECMTAWEHCHLHHFFGVWTNNSWPDCIHQSPPKKETQNIFNPHYSCNTMRMAAVQFLNLEHMYHIIVFYIHSSCILAWLFSETSTMYNQIRHCGHWISLTHRGEQLSVVQNDSKTLELYVHFMRNAVLNVSGQIGARRSQSEDLDTCQVGAGEQDCIILTKDIHLQNKISA